MSLIVALLILVAGIAFDAMITHSLAGLLRRRKDPARLAFAATSLAVAVGALSVAAMQSTDDPGRFIAIGKWLLFPAGIVWTVSAVWFVALYTRVRILPWVMALSATAGVVLVSNALLPLGLPNAGPIELQTTSVLGMQVKSAVHPHPHPLHVLAEVFAILSLALLLYAAYVAWRRDGRGTAKHLALAVPVFAVASLFNTLNDHGVIAAYVLTQFGFVVVLVAMSVALRWENARTENELDRHREALEDIVAARVRELHRANDRLGQEVQVRQAAEQALTRRIADLDAIQHLSLELAERTDLQSTLSHVVHELRGLFAGRYAYVCVPADGAGQPLEAASGTDSGQADRLCGLLGSPDAVLSLVGSFPPGREPVIVADVEASHLAARIRHDLTELGIHQLLLAPLNGRSGVVGMLALARAGDDPRFSPKRVALAKTVADTLATAVENERLQAEDRRDAAAEERSRLARDLHDAVTQSMYSASLIAEALPAVFDRDPDEGMNNLVRLRRLVRAGLSELRSLLYELRPATLEAAELPVLLERLGDSLGGQLQVPIDITSQQEAAPPVDVKIAFYRVCQEAFSNIAKHSRASSVRACLEGDYCRLELRINDDGRGFDPDTVSADHMGLRIMQERMQAIGGTVRVTSEPGRGTAVEASWTDAAAGS